MSARAALVLGTFLLFAALVHGGIYAAGHDFVVNRFTGHFEFVPSDEIEEGNVPARHFAHVPNLTSSGAGARVVCLQRRR
jgi:hypothetical protein